MGCTCGKGQKHPQPAPQQHVNNNFPERQVAEDNYRVGGGIDWDELEREAKGENLRWVIFEGRLTA